MSCPVPAKASRAWLFISFPGAVTGGSFLPWAAARECVINLLSEEQAVSYPEKLMFQSCCCAAGPLAQRSVLHVAVAQGPSLTGVGGRSLGMGTGPRVEV